METQTQPVQIKEINQRVKGTDLLVFSYNPETNLYTYSAPFTLEQASRLVQDVNAEIKASHNGAKGLRQGLAVDKETREIYNMNTFKGILLNQALTRQGEVWLPTIEEGIVLQDNEMLNPNAIIDFGAALYSEEDPNKQIATSFLATAQSKGYALPILASFKSMALEAKGKEYGVTPQLISPEGLIVGEEAQKLLKEQFRYVGNSGFRRLYRYRFGGWDPYWGGLDFFDEVCRVGRFSAEGSAQNLRELALSEFETKKREIEKGLEAVLICSILY